MLLIRIGFLCFIAFLYGATSLECPENEDIFGASPNSLNYRNQFVGILNAFEHNDIQQMDEILTFLVNEGVEQFVDQDYDYEKDSLRFVVCFRI